jgi:hypothetical protein
MALTDRSAKSEVTRYPPRASGATLRPIHDARPAELATGPRIQDTRGARHGPSEVRHGVTSPLRTTDRMVSTVSDLEPPTRRHPGSDRRRSVHLIELPAHGQAVHVLTTLPQLERHERIPRLGLPHGKHDRSHCSHGDDHHPEAVAAVRGFKTTDMAFKASQEKAPILIQQRNVEFRHQPEPPPSNRPGTAIKGRKSSRDGPTGPRGATKRPLPHSPGILTDKEPEEGARRRSQSKEPGRNTR